MKRQPSRSIWGVLRRGLHAHPHAVQVERAVAAARRAAGADYPPVAAGAVEELLAVVGDRDRRRLLDEVLRLAVLQRVLEQLSTPETTAFRDKHRALGPGNQPGIVLHRQSGRVDDAALDALEVDLDIGRDVLSRASALVRVASAVPRATPAFIASLLILVFVPLFIAPRKEGRGLVLAEQRQDRAHA